MNESTMKNEKIRTSFIMLFFWFLFVFCYVVFGGCKIVFIEDIIAVFLGSSFAYITLRIL